MTVSLVNIAPASTATNATAPSCSGTVTFANAAGIDLAGSPIKFTTTGSLITTESLSATAAGVTTSAPHAQVLASVQQTTTRPSTSPCSLVFSLSTFDTAGGVTHVFLGNASAAVAPTPMPVVQPFR